MSIKEHIAIFFAVVIGTVVGRFVYDFAVGFISEWRALWS